MRNAAWPRYVSSRDGHTSPRVLSCRLRQSVSSTLMYMRSSYSMPHEVYVIGICCCIAFTLVPATSVKVSRRLQVMNHGISALHAHTTLGL